MVELMIDGDDSVTFSPFEVVTRHIVEGDPF